MVTLIFESDKKSIYHVPDQRRNSGRGVTVRIGKYPQPVCLTDHKTDCEHCIACEEAISTGTVVRALTLGDVLPSALPMAD